MITKRIIPCLDVKNGRVVKGMSFVNLVDAGDPVECAKQYDVQGADELVFLDITASSDSRNITIDMVEKVANTIFIPFTVGGGIRDMKAVEYYLSRGIDRVILGSAAVKNPQLVIDSVREYGDRIVVGIDAKDGMVRAEGWLDNSEINYIELAKRMEDVGVQTIVFTDIDQGGTLAGPNLSQLSELVNSVSCNIIASGGVAVLKDIINLADLNVYGAICGKAIYSGILIKIDYFVADRGLGLGLKADCPNQDYSKKNQKQSKKQHITELPSYTEADRCRW